MKKKKIAKYKRENEVSMTAPSLYEKVKWGDLLTTGEKNFLRKILEDETGSENGELSIAIEAFVLSHPATSENIALVEKFLSEKFHYGIFVGTALKALCYDYYWNLSKEYLSLLKNILLRQEFDDELFSRASTALGMYLSHNKDEETFHFIYNLFQQTLKEYVPKCDWEIKDKVRDLYEALRYASAPREKRNNIYFEIKEMRFPEDVNDEVLLEYLK